MNTCKCGHTYQEHHYCAVDGTKRYRHCFEPGCTCTNFDPSRATLAHLKAARKKYEQEKRDDRARWPG